jgi:type I restriction enzyme R subunit
MTKLLGNIAKEDPNYCVRIVSKDGEVGKDWLEKFSDPKEKLPVIAVTSRLMSTGIDAPTCRNIILDKTLRSMTEFKQIIGRGTRVYEMDNKFWFTIIDFSHISKYKK